MTGQPSPIEQWAINFLATHPDPGLTPGQYAIGAIIMGVIVFLVITVIADVVGYVSKGLSRFIYVIARPTAALFALVAWLFMVT